MRYGRSKMEWDEVADDLAKFMRLDAYDALQWYLRDRVGHRHAQMASQDMTNEKLREALGERRANLAAAEAFNELMDLASEFAKVKNNG